MAYSLRRSLDIPLLASCRLRSFGLQPLSVPGVCGWPFQDIPSSNWDGQCNPQFKNQQQHPVAAMDPVVCPLAKLQPWFHGPSCVQGAPLLADWTICPGEERHCLMLMLESARTWKTTRPQRTIHWDIQSCWEPTSYPPSYSWENSQVLDV